MNIVSPNIGNIGEIIFSTNSNDLDNPSILEVKGQTVSRYDYFEFSEYLESNPIEEFRLDGDSIALPDWTSNFVRGKSNRDIGNYQQAQIGQHSHINNTSYNVSVGGLSKINVVQSVGNISSSTGIGNAPQNIASKLCIRVKPAMGTIWKSLGASKVDFSTLWVGIRQSSQFILNLETPSVFCMVEFTEENIFKIFFVDSVGELVTENVPIIDDLYVNPDNFTGSTLVATVNFPIIVDNEFLVINEEITFELIDRGNIRLTINDEVIILTSTSITEDIYLSEYSIPIEGLGLDAFNISKVKVRLQFTQFYDIFTFIKLFYIDEYGVQVPINNLLLGNVSRFNVGVAGITSKTSLNVNAKGIGVLADEEFNLNLSFNGNQIFSNEILGIDKYTLASEYNTWSSLHHSSSINVVGWSDEGYQFRSIMYIMENDKIFLINEFGQKLSSVNINGSNYDITEGVLDKLLPSVLSNKNRARLQPPNFPSTSNIENVTLIKNDDDTINFNTAYFNGVEVLLPIGGMVNWDGFYISKSFDRISGINPTYGLPITKYYLALTINSGLLSMFFIDDYGIRLDQIVQEEVTNEILSEVIEFQNMVYGYLTSITFKIMFPSTTPIEQEQIIFNRNPNYYSMQSFLTPVDRFGEFTKDPELVIWDDRFISKYEESFLGFNTTEGKIRITKRRLVVDFDALETILNIYYIDEYGNQILSFESDRQATINYAIGEFDFVQGTLTTTGGRGLFIIEDSITDNTKIKDISSKAWVSNNRFLLFRYISNGFYYIDGGIKKSFDISNNQLTMDGVLTSSFAVSNEFLNINGTMYTPSEVPTAEDLIEILQNGSWVWTFDSLIETYVFFENGLGSVNGVQFNWECIDGYFYKNNRLNEDLTKITFALSLDCTSITLGTKQCVSDFYQSMPTQGEEYFTFNFANDEGLLTMSNSNLGSFNTFARG